MDYATYNPLSLVLEQKILEKAFEKDGVSIVWVQSLGSQQGAGISERVVDRFWLDGWSGGALLAKLNGNPIKSVYVYSRPEWTALRNPEETGISKVADLKGKRVAVTREPTRTSSS